MMKNSNIHLATQQWISVTFLSPAPFYSNPVRSFLQYLQNSNNAFQFLNFPKNLYTASETLTQDYQPLTFSLQLPDNSQHPVAINITPKQDDSAMLTLNFTSADVVKYLLNEQASLIDILSTGARMTRAESAFVSLAAPTSKVKLENGRLHLEKLPLILWTTAPLSEEISDITADARTSQQQDGALLIISKALSPNRSLWTDSTQTRYFLILDRQQLNNGNFTIRNLDNDQKEVALSELTSFQITETEAKAYLETEIIQTIEQAKSSFDNIINFSVETPENKDSTTNISKIVAAILGINSEELQNNPEAVQACLQNLLILVKEVIENSLSQNQTQLNIARERMRSLQATLRANGVDLGDTLAQFPDKLHALHFDKQPASLHQLTAKLRKFVDKLNQSAADKQQNFGEVMAAFVTSYQEIFGKDEELEKEKLQQYRQMATDAIANSLSDFKMPSFDFQDLVSGINQQPDEEQK